MLVQAQITFCDTLVQWSAIGSVGRREPCESSDISTSSQVAGESLGRCNFSLDRDQKLAPSPWSPMGRGRQDEALGSPASVLEARPIRKSPKILRNLLGLTNPNGP